MHMLQCIAITVCVWGGGGVAMKQLSLLHGEIKAAAGQLAGMNGLFCKFDIDYIYSSYTTKYTAKVDIS